MVKGRVTLVCTVCGDTFRREKFFTRRRDADSWERYMEKLEGCTCPSCWKASLAKEERRQAALAMSDCPVEFPVLKGTVKQVRWATNIRNSTLIALSGANFKWETILDSKYRKAEEQRDVDLLFTDDSKVWIDALGKELFGRVYIG
jgi:hypothetical protein